MLAAYFDESIGQPTAKEPDLPRVYTVAGVLAHVEQWGSFSKEWNKVLKEANVEFFHMTDYESRIGVYRDWNDKKRLTVLRSLHSLINKYVLKSFTTSIVLADYEALSDRERWVFGEPHMVALFNCLKKIHEICKELDIHTPIHYVFEQNPKVNGLIANAFSDLTEVDREGYRIASYSFMNKRCQPLQAADMLAYEAMKHKTNDLKPENKKRPTRKSILNLSDPKSDEWFYMDTKEFEKTLSFIKGLYDLDDEYQFQTDK